LAIFYSSPFICPLGFALNTLASLPMIEGGPMGNRAQASIPSSG
jgi:hypothetical protein